MYALFVGPAFVLAAVSDNWGSRNFDAPPIGMPAAEAWPDEAWRPLQARMREAWATGRSFTLDLSTGAYAVVPILADARPVAVVAMRPGMTTHKGVATGHNVALECA